MTACRRLKWQCGIKALGEGTTRQDESVRWGKQVSIPATWFATSLQPFAGSTFRCVFLCIHRLGVRGVSGSNTIQGTSPRTLLHAEFSNLLKEPSGKRGAVSCADTQDNGHRSCLTKSTADWLLGMSIPSVRSRRTAERAWQRGNVDQSGVRLRSFLVILLDSMHGLRAFYIYTNAREIPPWRPELTC